MPSQLNILGPPEASSAATTGAGARGGGQEKRRWLAGWLPAWASPACPLRPAGPGGRPGRPRSPPAPTREGRLPLRDPRRRFQSANGPRGRLRKAASPRSLGRAAPVEDTSLHAAGSRRGHAAEAGREGRAAAAARGGRCLRAALQEMGRRRKSAAPGRRRPFFPAGEAASGGAILRRGATPRKSRAWGGDEDTRPAPLSRRDTAPPRGRCGVLRPGRHFIRPVPSL